MLIGGLSLARLPVDLMPDVSFPSITVRVGYAGVGPLEMEELVTRPIEQALSAVAGLERLESTSSEGSARVTLNFAWGTDLNEAADDMRSRLDRVRGRLPEEADAPVMFKFDANARPSWASASKATTTASSCARSPSTTCRRGWSACRASPRSPSKAAFAARFTSSSPKRRSRALDLPVDRVVNLLRTENQNIPLGEIDEGDRTYLVRSQGQFENLDEIRDLVVMTRRACPSTCGTSPRSRTRPRTSARSRASTASRACGCASPSSRARTRSRSPTAVRAEIGEDQPRDARRHDDVARRQLDLHQPLDHAVQEHALVGGFLVMLIIFLFLRDLRATFIVFTSIPISVIGTFALLYFNGYTLNTMTFGGLALGIGMIVDASIVVLENTFRHMEHGKDRMTASIDGSEEVWSAILASTLTHIAVFVPLLFLTGVSSIMFKQLSIVVMFSLTMSLFVAVTIVPVLCSRLLKLPPPLAERRGLTGRLYTWSERSSTAWTSVTAASSTSRSTSPDRPRRRHGVRRCGSDDPADHRLRADAADG